MWKDEEEKKFSLLKEEEAEIKRMASTMGFFRTAMEGIRLSMSLMKAQIEQRLLLDKPIEGYKIQTQLDIDNSQIIARKVKIGEEKTAETEKIENKN